jgi:hypothetical protein
LPHLLTVVMEYFDVALDNEPDLIARGVSTPYRPPVRPSPASATDPHFQTS